MSFDFSKSYATFVAHKDSTDMPRKEFGNFRVSKKTIETLSKLKIAFESCYARHITNDDLIQKLIDCVEDGDEAVYQAFCDILAKEEMEQDHE